MNNIVRFAAAAVLLACVACSVTTAPAPTPVVVQQPTVTTVPPGSTVIVPRPAY